MSWDHLHQTRILKLLCIYIRSSSRGISILVKSCSRGNSWDQSISNSILQYEYTIICFHVESLLHRARRDNEIMEIGVFHSIIRRFWLRNSHENNLLVRESVGTEYIGKRTHDTDKIILISSMIISQTLPNLDKHGWLMLMREFMHISSCVFTQRQWLWMLSIAHFFVDTEWEISSGFVITFKYYRYSGLIALGLGPASDRDIVN